MARVRRLRVELTPPSRDGLLHLAMRPGRWCTAYRIARRVDYFSAARNWVDARLEEMAASGEIERQKTPGRPAIYRMPRGVKP
jgi:hypothetical protein